MATAWNRLLPKDRELALEIARERGVDFHWLVTLTAEIWNDEVEVEIEAATEHEAGYAAADITDLDDFDIRINAESVKRLDSSYDNELEKIAEEIVGIECKGQTKMFAEAPKGGK